MKSVDYPSDSSAIAVRIERILEGTPRIRLHAAWPDHEGFDAQLPTWRPGRYELGQFAQFMYRMEGQTPEGNWVELTKTDLHRWRVPKGIRSLRWEFYADLFNAGSTGVDSDILYVNPVNCFLYDPQKMHLGYDIELTDVPETWDVACGLERNGRHLIAADVQQAMDCPILAAESLTHQSFTSHEIEFHIWIYGRNQPDAERFLKEHRAFTDAQIAHFGSFPASEYHFMYLLPEREVRHGVEHENSTVIALGPSEKSQTEDGHMELIGIASHELYHVWNVKRIRPTEWMPYDFSKACPSRMGYVAEGVTTYMGDLFLFESGIVDLQGWCALTVRLLNRHINNAGRLNLSVADSSFDTWLDGYVAGVPGRKGSIYVEGAVLALLCDVRIMQLTGGEASLQTAMRLLWEQFGEPRIGLTESDYWSVLNEVAGAPEALDDLRREFADGTEDSWDSLVAAMDWQGLQLSKELREGMWYCQLEPK
ncbi:MAG: M61 family peptidase [Bacteroidetes bacterium]|nr:M61 family peptidase [Bacteroidota bacterium]MDA1336667.1 M61 family peptidase [Bacteroidota bacterium]